MSARDLVDALAFSWALEAMSPSERAVAEAARAVDERMRRVPLPWRTPFPDWRARANWRLATSREIDAEFQHAVVGVAELLDGARWRESRPSALARMAHRALFATTWPDAGEQRQVELNIGVAWHQVSHALAILDADWRQDPASPTTARLAALHERFESIHPWRDGNGRSGRLMIDLLLLGVGQPNASWGAGRRGARARYLDAVVRASRLEVEPLARLIG